MSSGLYCGDWAPSGRHTCNRPEGHQFEHSFGREGVPVATWPREASIYRRGGDVQAFIPAPTADELARAELRQWWLDRAEDEIDRTVPKAIEYGSGDLIEIGRDLATLMGREVTDQEATELGIYFYIRGKMARWADAIRRGVPASDDTLFDLGVYVRMAQRSRSHGGWPGVKETAE